MPAGACRARGLGEERGAGVRGDPAAAAAHAATQRRRRTTQRRPGRGDCRQTKPDRGGTAATRRVNSPTTSSSRAAPGRADRSGRRGDGGARARDAAPARQRRPGPGKGARRRPSGAQEAASPPGTNQGWLRSSLHHACPPHATLDRWWPATQRDLTLWDDRSGPAASREEGRESVAVMRLGTNSGAVSISVCACATDSVQIPARTTPPPGVETDGRRRHRRRASAFSWANALFVGCSDQCLCSIASRPPASAPLAGAAARQVHCGQAVCSLHLPDSSEECTARHPVRPSTATRQHPPHPPQEQRARAQPFHASGEGPPASSARAQQSHHVPPTTQFRAPTNRGDARWRST